MGAIKKAATNEDIPVFIFKRNDQVGNGVYQMTACFIGVNVHVNFSFEAHSENEYLLSAHKATACDGSCERYFGKLENYAKPRHDSQYGVEPILEKFSSFCLDSLRKNR